MSQTDTVSTPVVADRLSLKCAYTVLIKRSIEYQKAAREERDPDRSRRLQKMAHHLGVVANQLNPLGVKAVDTTFKLKRD